MTPNIYFRLSRPLKEDAQIDPIQISLFYAEASSHGLSLNITPDYGFT